jgi:hypothetical protein
MCESRVHVGFGDGGAVVDDGGAASVKGELLGGGMRVALEGTCATIDADSAVRDRAEP